MTAENPDARHPYDEPPRVLPGTFIGPHRMPVHVSIENITDDHAQGWVLLRTETVHGSHAVFLLPDIADNVAMQLAQAAGRARIIVTGNN